MSVERGATGSIPSYPANGEREAMAGTDMKKEEGGGGQNLDRHGERREMREKRDRVTCEIDRE